MGFLGSLRVVVYGKGASISEIVVFLESITY
jgi:hypothetical protein